MNDVFVTATGRLVKSPRLSRTGNGTPVANLRIACTPRRFAEGQWTDAAPEPIYLNVVAWGDLGEHVAASLTKGTRVLVTGRLRQHTYDAGHNHRCTGVEIIASEVAPSLHGATATVVRKQHGTGAADAATLPYDEPADSESEPREPAA